MNEIILYQADELPERIEVRVGEETVWLNQDQLSTLFQRDQSVISRHIRNVFKEGELDEKSNMQKMHIANSDKPVVYYNLDVIISIGYRVKSKQGTQLRIWATNVLREYLTKGYAINNRMNRLEDKMDKIDKKVNEIDFQIKSTELPAQGIFFDGQIFDAYELTSKIIRSAKKSIFLIDNYIDESTLTHLSKKTKAVKVLLLTKTISKQLTLDVKKANEQYGNFELKNFTKSHDRFLKKKKKDVYHIGASLKDLGKKWFAFSKMEKHFIENILNEIENYDGKK